MKRTQNIKTVQFDDGEIELPGSIKLVCTATGRTVFRGRDYVTNMCRKRFNNKWQDLIKGFQLLGRGTCNSHILDKWRSEHPKQSTIRRSQEKMEAIEQLARTVVPVSQEVMTSEELDDYYKKVCAALHDRVQQTLEYRERAKTNTLSVEDAQKLTALHGMIDSLKHILRTKFDLNSTQVLHVMRGKK